MVENPFRSFFFEQRDPFRCKDEDTQPVINDKETQLWFRHFLIGTEVVKNIVKEGEFYFLQFYVIKIAKKIVWSLGQNSNNKLMV